MQYSDPINLSLINEPEILFFSSAPLSSRNCKIKPLSTAQVNKLMQNRRKLDHEFQWSENPQLDAKYYSKNEQNLEHFKSKKWQEFSKRLVDLESLVLCFINEDVGFGVWSSCKIPAGSCIIYSGFYSDDTNNLLDSDYAIAGLHIKTLNRNANAKYIGGFGGLIQDLAHPVISRIDESIDTNNFEFREMQIGEFSLFYLESIVDIEPYKQLGVNYGHSFWGHENEKSYFSEGKIISKPKAKPFSSIDMIFNKVVVIWAQEFMGTMNPIDALVSKIEFETNDVVLRLLSLQCDENQFSKYSSSKLTRLLERLEGFKDQEKLEELTRKALCDEIDDTYATKLIEKSYIRQFEKLKEDLYKLISMKKKSKNLTFFDIRSANAVSTDRLIARGISKYT